MQAQPNLNLCRHCKLRFTRPSTWPPVREAVRDASTPRVPQAWCPWKGRRQSQLEGGQAGAGKTPARARTVAAAARGTAAATGEATAGASAAGSAASPKAKGGAPAEERKRGERNRAEEKEGDLGRQRAVEQVLTPQRSRRRHPDGWPVEVFGRTAEEGLGRSSRRWSRASLK